MHVQRKNWRWRTIGVALAYGLNSVLTTAIEKYPIARHPGLVYAATVGSLGIISLIAVLIPAIKGARVAPMEALRYE